MMHPGQSIFWLKLILLAVLDIPIVALALYYGRPRPGGSNPTLRAVLYSFAASLWLLVVVVMVTR